MPELINITYVSGNERQKLIVDRVEELAHSLGATCFVSTVWNDPEHPGDPMPHLILSPSRAEALGDEVEEILENGLLEKVLSAE